MSFEADFSVYTGIPHCLGTCSGTSALHLALKVAGVAHGDEVWCPTLTFIGGVSPVVFVGAKPVFVDCDDYLTIDVSLFTGRKPPKAIIATDLFGQSCDWEALRGYCDANNVILIADSAEAVGSFYKGRHSGYHADIAVYSFNNNKIITTLGGGMIASHNKDWVDRARFLSSQARENVGWYEHKEIGFNYRMNLYAANAGRKALKNIGRKVKRHRLDAKLYGNRFEIVPERPDSTGNRWMSVVKTDLLALRQENIDVRPMFKPMHMQPVFKGCETIGGERAEQAFRDYNCIPLLNIEQRKRLLDYSRQTNIMAA